MRLLLDTHALLWWVDDDPQLSTQARNLIGDAENDCHVSLVSAWEMAIKCATGKLKLAVSVQRYYQEHLPAFLILSGLSGSGKTKLAQALARWLTPAAEDGEAAYALIPVGADWTGNDSIWATRMDSIPGVT